MQSAHEIVAVAQRVEDVLSHARHDRHVEHDVNAVGELDADLGEGRADRAHREGDDVHRPALHRTLIDALEQFVRLVFLHPVVGGTGVLLLLGADEGASFHTRNVVDGGAMQIASGQKLLIEPDHLAGGNCFVAERFKLFLASVDEHDLVGRAQSDALIDELLNAFVFKLHDYLRRAGGFPHTQLLYLFCSAAACPDKGYTFPFTNLFTLHNKQPRILLWLSLCKSVRPSSSECSDFSLRESAPQDPPERLLSLSLRFHDY